MMYINALFQMEAYIINTQLQMDDYIPALFQREDV